MPNKRTWSAADNESKALLPTGWQQFLDQTTFRTLMMYLTESDRSGLCVSAVDSSFCLSTSNTITTEIAA